MTRAPRTDTSQRAEGAPGASHDEVALLATDLAPGDRAVATHDWSDLRVRRVRDASDPDFEPAYARLCEEFGPRGEMETRDVIRARLAWDPARPTDRAAFAYELLVLRRGGALAAVRDHTAVVRVDASGRPERSPVVVHLSHVLVEPAQRGSGLAAWLRALPLQTARRCAAAAGAAPDTPVVLVAEMDPVLPEEPDGVIRLRSYERAGFRKVDPIAAPYAQPDFRPPGVLATQPAQSVPLALVVRRVGRETETSISSEELAAVVDALYTLYAVHVPPHALDPLRAAAAAWTARQPNFRLLLPTA